MLIYILICLFILLTSYQIILAIYPSTVMEGLENTSTKTQDYKPYNVSDPNNSLILAQQNSGNIEVLNGRVDKYTTLQDSVTNDISNIKLNVSSMQTQIDGLVQQQSNYAQELAGSTPPDITGIEGETIENVEKSIEEEDNEDDEQAYTI